jgi:hypothetical protein
MKSKDSQPDQVAAEFVATNLERLISLPLDSPEDMKRWENECANFQKLLETRSPAFEVEHHIWHFFTDSDIRQKDIGYKQRQHQAVADYIRGLRQAVS